MKYEALFAALLSIAICLLLLWALKRVKFEVNVSSTSLFISLVFFYLMFANTLAEINVFGFRAKMKDTIHKPAEFFEMLPNRIVGHIFLSKVPVSKDVDKYENLVLDTLFGAPQRVIVIDGDYWNTLEDWKRHTFSIRMAVSIYQSILAGGFEGLVIIDRLKKPVGIFPRSYFNDLLRLPLDRIAVDEKYEKFVLTNQVITARFRETNLAGVLVHPIRRAELVSNRILASENTSLSKLYKLLQKHNLNSIILTNLRGEYVGIVTADSVQRQISASLIDFLDKAQ